MKGPSPQYGGGRVAADGNGAATDRIVRESTSHQPHDAGEAVGNPLDEPEPWCAERAGEEPRQKRGRDLMPEIREEARRAMTQRPESATAPAYQFWS
jgi:hypothetical protein